MQHYIRSMNFSIKVAFSSWTRSDSEQACEPHTPTRSPIHCQNPLQALNDIRASELLNPEAVAHYLYEAFMPGADTKFRPRPAGGIRAVSRIAGDDFYGNESVLVAACQALLSMVANGQTVDDSDVEYYVRLLLGSLRSWRRETTESLVPLEMLVGISPLLSVSLTCELAVVTHVVDYLRRRRGVPARDLGLDLILGILRRTGVTVGGAFNPDTEAGKKALEDLLEVVKAILWDPESKQRAAACEIVARLAADYPPAAAIAWDLNIHNDIVKYLDARVDSLTAADEDSACRALAWLSVVEPRIRRELNKASVFEIMFYPPYRVPRNDCLGVPLSYKVKSLKADPTRTWSDWAERAYCVITSGGHCGVGLVLKRTSLSRRARNWARGRLTSQRHNFSDDLGVAEEVSSDEEDEESGSELCSMACVNCRRRKVC